MQTKNLRRISCAAVLAALSAATAPAHHQGAAEREFLAFWSGYRPISTPAPTPETCQDGLYWTKGFVSIYSQGAE